MTAKKRKSLAMLRAYRRQAGGNVRKYLESRSGRQRLRIALVMIAVLVVVDIWVFWRSLSGRTELDIDRIESVRLQGDQETPTDNDN